MSFEITWGFEGFPPYVLLSSTLGQSKSAYYKPESSTNFKQDTAISLSTTEKIWKDKMIELIEKNNIKVNDKYLLDELLDKLEEERMTLLYQITEYLIKNNYRFSIEVYETDGDLEQLYFVVHFPSKADEEEIDKEILYLVEYKMNIDKNKLLWFVGFADEIENV